MTTQELLTFLFDAIALGFITIAAMDFGTRVVMAYNQVIVASNSPSTNIEKLVTQIPLAAIPHPLPQLPDPWLLPLTVKEAVTSARVVYKEQNYLRLLPQAKAISVPNLEFENVLQGVNVDKLKLRQARKIAKALGIAQKVNGRDQKLEFLVGQIKLKLQQAKAEIIELVKQELIAC